MELLRWFLEGLFDLLTLYFSFWIRFADMFAEGFDIPVSPIITRGLFVLVGAFVLGGPLYWALHWDRIGHRPQAIVLQTQRTPNQIVRQDVAHLFRSLVIAVLLGIGLAMLIASITAPPPLR